MTRLLSAISFFTGGPPDPRSGEQIDADIADEIAFHLHHAQRELRETDRGLSHEQADRAAEHQFGNVAAISRELKFIAMKERIMLQKVNFILMVLVLIVIAGVSIQVFITQRYNTLALQELMMQLTQMKIDAQAGERETSHAPSTRAFVSNGDGTTTEHHIPLTGVTQLSDLLVSLGVKDYQWVGLRDISEDAADMPISWNRISSVGPKGHDAVIHPSLELHIVELDDSLNPSIVALATHDRWRLSTPIEGIGLSIDVASVTMASHGRAHLRFQLENDRQRTPHVPLFVSYWEGELKFTHLGDKFDSPLDHSIADGTLTLTLPDVQIDRRTLSWWNDIVGQTLTFVPADNT